VHNFTSLGVVTCSRRAISWPGRITAAKEVQVAPVTPGKIIASYSSEVGCGTTTLEALGRLAGCNPCLPIQLWPGIERTNGLYSLVDVTHDDGSDFGRGDGVDAKGDKHPLRLIEGATENPATVQALIDNLVERGLDSAVPRLFIIDGAKALSKSIRRTFGRTAAIQRCQVHKARNIMERLPKALHASVRRALRQAWDWTTPTRLKCAILPSVSNETGPG
jgi:hypothetical protein